MANDGEFRYDLFIVHADSDRAWVDGYLRHAVGVEPDRLITRRDFQPGAVIADEYERAVASSRYTALVLSPAYLADRWAEFGEQLVSFTSVEEGRGRVVALTLEPCQPPARLRFLVGLDFTNRRGNPVSVHHSGGEIRCQFIIQGKSGVSSSF